MSSVTLMCECGASLRTRKGKTRTDAANNGWRISKGTVPVIECVTCTTKPTSEARSAND